MSNTNFLAKYGDDETRTKLSAINGPHESMLYHGPQKPTDEMIMNSLKSPNYNATTAAIKTRRLNREHMEHIVNHGYSQDVDNMLNTNNVPHDIIKKITDKAKESRFDLTHANELATASVHEDKPQAERNAIHSELLEHPFMHRALAPFVDVMSDENKDKFVHKIIQHNSDAAQNVISYSHSIKPEHVEALLNHFPDDERLHRYAAKDVRLTDSRVEKNLQNPKLAQAMRTNTNLTPTQYKKVPGHIFTELDMFK